MGYRSDIGSGIATTIGLWTDYIEVVSYSSDFSDIGHSNAKGRCRVTPDSSQVVLSDGTYAVVVLTYLVEFELLSRVSQEDVVGSIQDLMDKHFNPRSTSLQTNTTNTSTKINGKTLVAQSALSGVNMDDPQAPSLVYTVSVKANITL